MRSSSLSIQILLCALLVVIQGDSCEARYYPAQSLWRSFRVSSSEQHSKKTRERPKKSIQKIHRALTTGKVKSGPKFVHHCFYWITSLDAVYSIFENEYCTSFRGFVVVKHTPVISKLFYFARLRPRLLYSVGALLRALQMCTPLERIFDPRVGVGAGINLFAFLAGSRWVKPLVLGWATTKWLWSWLGAGKLPRAYVPITLSIHEWEKRNRKKQNQGEGNDGY